MTKQVRIENADTSDHVLRVFTENKNAAGEWVRSAAAVDLSSPTAMMTGCVWARQRLVIEEVVPAIAEAPSGG